MKKIILSAAFLVGMAVVMISCSGNFVQDVFNLVDGRASSTIDGEGTRDYSSSVAMYDDETDNPSVIGLATSMDVDVLMNISGEEDLEFPFMVYRVVGSDFSSGNQFSVNNVLTEEDVENFDYRSLINGDLADNHLVGVAVSPTQFYIMNSGTITLNKVKANKIIGEFSGTAYKLDIEATPKLSDKTVTFSGDFKSRVIPMMDWLRNQRDSIR